MGIADKFKKPLQSVIGIWMTMYNLLYPWGEDGKGTDPPGIWDDWNDIGIGNTEKGAENWLKKLCPQKLWPKGGVYGKFCVIHCWWNGFEGGFCSRENVCVCDWVDTVKLASKGNKKNVDRKSANDTDYNDDDDDYEDSSETNDYESPSKNDDKILEEDVESEETSEKSLKGADARFNKWLNTLLIG